MSPGGSPCVARRFIAENMCRLAAHSWPSGGFWAKT